MTSEDVNPAHGTQETWMRLPAEHRSDGTPVELFAAGCSETAVRRLRLPRSAIELRTRRELGPSRPTPLHFLAGDCQVGGHVALT